tara:strand:+ start:2138 stop:4204 length:2067 start_codon:yes stop_codon:yes gene_type:complete
MSTRKEALQEAINRGPDFVSTLSPKLQGIIARGVELGELNNPSMEEEPEVLDFSNAEVELWSRDNLSDRKIKKTPYNQRKNMMIADFQGSGMEKNEFLGFIEPDVAGGTTFGTGEKFAVNFGQGLKDFVGEQAKLMTSAADVGFGGIGSVFGQGPYVGPGSGFEDVGQATLDVNQNIRKQIQAQRDEFSESKIAQGLSGAIPRIGGQIAPIMLMPSGYSSTAKFLPNVLKTSAAGGFTGFLMPTDKEATLNEQRIFNVVAGVATGPFGPILVPLWKGAGNVIGSFTQRGGKKSIETSAKEQIKKESAKLVKTAKEEFDVFITPAEASKAKDLIKRESEIVLKNSEETNISKLLDAREENLFLSIDDLRKSLKLDDDQVKLLNEGYTALKNTKFTPKFLDKIKSDDILGDLWTAFNKDKVSLVKLKEAGSKYGEDSLYTMELFRRYVAKQSQKLKKPGDTQDLDLARLYDSKLYGIADENEVYSVGLVNVLDNLVPEYAVSRQLAGYKIAQRQINQRLSKIKGTVDDAGNIRPNAMQFYDEFLSTNAKADEFLKMFDGIPQAQIKVQQLRKILNAVKGSPLEKIFKGDNIDLAPGGGAFGKIGALVQSIQKITKGRFNQGIIDYITDPAYADDILEELADAATDINKNNSKAMERFIKRLANTIGDRITTSRIITAAQPDSPEGDLEDQ